MSMASFLLFNTLLTFWFQIHLVEGIIDGYHAQPGQFKYTVSIQSYVLFGSKSDRVKRNVCTGVIISDQYVLTVAHCVMTTSSEFKNLLWSVIAGVVDPKDKDNIEVDVVKIIVPLNYDPKQIELNSVVSIYSDLAILKLEKKLGLQYHTKRLAAVNLPQLFSTAIKHEEETAIISGFGLSKSIEEIPSRTIINTPLNYAEIIIIPNSWCQLTTENLIRHDHICGQLKHKYNAETTVSVTKGDSGAPLVSNGNLLIGILSRSKPSEDGKYNVEIYTKIAFHVPFILAVISGQETSDTRQAVYEYRKTLTGYKKTIKEI